MRSQRRAESQITEIRHWSQVETGQWSRLVFRLFWVLVSVRSHHRQKSHFVSAESSAETRFLHRQTKCNKSPHRGTLSRRASEINEPSLVRWNSLLRLLLPVLSIPACRAALGLLTVMKRSITPPPTSSPSMFPLILPLAASLLSPLPAVIYLFSLCTRSYQFYSIRSSAANMIRATLLTPISS